MRRPIEFLEGGRAKHGETFTARLAKIGPMVFTSEPEVAKQVFAGDRENRIPAARNVLLEPIMGPRSVFLLEGEEHMRRRRLMLPAFHGERMRAYEALIRGITEREIATWPEGRPFPLHPRMQSLTLEVILRAVFGVENQERFDELRRLLGETLKMIESPNSLAFGLLVRRLGSFGPYRIFERQLEKTDALLAEEIARRRRDRHLDKRDDILSTMVMARFDDGGVMDDSELRDQLMTLLLAGHETTATGLAWTFDLLLHTPEVLKRLRAELAEGDDYLNAVIQESLRLRPVVGVVGRKLGSALEIDGHEIPAQTDVALAIYLAHTRPDVYTDPYEFRPERFLNGGPETYSWIPFGGGTRRCLGGAFAEFEMRVVLRRILSALELRAAEREPESVTRRNITFSPKRGTRVVVEGSR